MKINPAIASSAINRYEKVVHRQTAEDQGLSRADKIELSEQAKLYSSLIKAAREDFSSDLNENRVHAAMNQIAAGAYPINVSRLAAKMMQGTGGGKADE